MTKVDLVVSVDWLKDQIAKGTPNLVILDSSWLPDDHTTRDTYLKEHIPGALYFDFNRGVTSTQTFPRPMPDTQVFEAYIRDLGIDGDTHVVLYETVFLGCACKGWSFFKLFGHEKISILDGGLFQWKAQNGDLASGDETSKKKGNFCARLNKDRIVDYEGIVATIENKNMPIVDAREDIHFLGKEPEPNIHTKLALEHVKLPVPTAETMRAGHMPGAANIFRERIWHPVTFKYLTPDELRALFKDVGVDISKPFVSCCYIGHTATLMNFAAALCGNNDTYIYLGSWTEFAQVAPANLVVQ